MLHDTVTDSTGSRRWLSFGKVGRRRALPADNVFECSVPIASVNTCSSLLSLAVLSRQRCLSYAPLGFIVDTLKDLLGLGLEHVDHLEIFRVSFVAFCKLLL